LGGSKQFEKRMPGSQSRAYRFMLEASCRSAANRQRARTKQEYRDAVSELSKLSDHELSDIGISRSDIEYVARRPIASKASA
jgi:uncharacterized protein YjiS (DUF1127 family)